MDQSTILRTSKWGYYRVQNLEYGKGLLRPIRGTVSRRCVRGTFHSGALLRVLEALIHFFASAKRCYEEKLIHTRSSSRVPKGAIKIDKPSTSTRATFLSKWGQEKATGKRMRVSQPSFDSSRRKGNDVVWMSTSRSVSWEWLSMWCLMVKWWRSNEWFLDRG